MIIKSNTVKVNVIGTIPITLEGAQLAIQNAERLFFDSQKVSIPTKVALLEIGLEEISKAWAILLSFEKDLIDKNEEHIDVFLESAHIDNKKLKEKIEELARKKEEFFGKYNVSSFLTPFNTETFSNHKAKIKFLSKFIWYTREIQLQLSKSSYDMGKIINDVIGQYFPQNRLSNLKENYKAIYDILNINEDQLEDIVNLKEHGLYLDIQSGVYISPSSRIYETATLENLLKLLLVMAKGELIYLDNVLKKLSVKISEKKVSK